MKPNLFGLPPEELRKVAAGILGSYKSEKKSAAARENGKKGGRPKKKLSTGTPLTPQR